MEHQRPLVAALVACICVAGCSRAGPPETGSAPPGVPTRDPSGLAIRAEFDPRKHRSMAEPVEFDVVLENRSGRTLVFPPGTVGGLGVNLFAHLARQDPLPLLHGIVETGPNTMVPFTAAGEREDLVLAPGQSYRIPVKSGIHRWITLVDEEAPAGGDRGQWLIRVLYRPLPALVRAGAADPSAGEVWSAPVISAVYTLDFE